MHYGPKSSALLAFFMSEEPDAPLRGGRSGNVNRTATTPPQTYLYLALYAFALVGLELVLQGVEPVLALPPNSFQAHIVHWTLTIIVWLGGAIALLAWALGRTDFTLRGDVPIGPVRWLIVVALIVLTLAAQWMLHEGALPPVAEHLALSQRFADSGTIAWLVQVAYYFAELAVIVLIIAFGQKAGEGWLRSRWIPSGAILLALTWGLVHFLTQDSATGLYGIALSLAMGCVYVLARKNLFLAYPLLLLMFIL